MSTERMAANDSLNEYTILLVDVTKYSTSAFTKREKEKGVTSAILVACFRWVPCAMFAICEYRHII